MIILKILLSILLIPFGIIFGALGGVAAILLMPFILIADVWED